MFWARASGTVEGMKHSVKQMFLMRKRVGLEPNFPALSPSLLGNNFEYNVVIAML